MNIDNLKAAKIRKTKIEKEITLRNSKKTIAFTKILHVTNNINLMT